MRDAGFGPDNRLRTTYLIRSTSGRPGFTAAAALQQMFSVIYVDISIVPADAQIFYGKIQEHDYEMSQPGWQADFRTMLHFLDIFRSDSGNNWGNMPAVRRQR